MKTLATSILLSLLWLSAASAVTNTWQVGGVDTKWSTAGNWSAGHKPAATEDVVMPVSTGPCNVDEATAAINSLDMTGYTHALSGSANITVTVASGTSTVLFAGTSPTWSGILNLNPAAGATINLTMGSLTTAGTIGGITIAGTTTGAVYFLDGVTMGATKIVTLTSGTLHSDGATDNAGLTHSWGLFYSSGAVARTLTLGNSVIGITGASTTVWDMTTVTNLTSTQGATGSITFSGAAAVGKMGGKTYAGTVAFTGSGAASLGAVAGSSFGTLTRTATAVKTDSFIIPAAITVTGTLNLNGNSTVNRLLVYATTLGTPVIITCSGATVSTSNSGFRDITFARSTAGALDLTNGGANLVGDCGGNSKTLGDSAVLTFTTSRTCNFINDAGGNWADVANWDTATDADRVPLPQDDVTFTNEFTSSSTITANMPRLGRSISFAGATAAAPGVLPAFALGNVVTNYGSLNLTGLKASGFSGDYFWYFESQARSGTNYLTSNGQSFPGYVYIQPVGSTLQLADAFVAGSNNSLVVYNGTFVDAGFSVTAPRFISDISSTQSVTKTGNWILNASVASNVMQLASTGLIWSDTAGTITLSDTGNNAKTFVGAGKTFNNLTITGGGTGAIVLTGNNTFTGTVTCTGPKTLQFENNSIATAATWTLTGTAGNTIDIQPVTNDGSAHFHIAKTGGSFARNNFLDVTNSVANTANTFYYGSGGSGDAFSKANGWAMGAAGVMRYYQTLLQNQ